MTSSSENTLYQRLGGYDAIAAAVDDLMPRLFNESSNRGLSKRSKRPYEKERTPNDLSHGSNHTYTRNNLTERSNA